MTLDIEARNVENENTLGIYNSRFANSLFYSAVMHAVAAYFVIAAGGKLINADRKIPQNSMQRSISVSLYGRDFLNGVASSKVNHSGESLTYFVNAVPKTEHEDVVSGASDLDGIVGRMGKTLDAIHGDLYAINQNLQGIHQDLQGIREGIQDIRKEIRGLTEYVKGAFIELGENIRKGRKESELYGGMRVILSQNGDVSQYFSDTFMLEERDEQAYLKFFRAYADAYFDLNKPPELILPILKTNSNLLQLMNVKLEIDGQGLIKIIKLDTFDGFNNEDRTTSLTI